MTALQDWLSIRPVDPKGLKAIICDALRSLTGRRAGKGPRTPADPQGRGALLSAQGARWRPGGGCSGIRSVWSGGGPFEIA